MLITGKPNSINLTRFRELLDKVLDSNVLTNDGPLVKQLEEKLSEASGVYCVAVANATLGLEFLSRVFWREGVGMTAAMPSFTFCATPYAFSESYDIEFCDLDEQASPGRSLSSPSLPINADAYVLCNLFGQCADLQFYEDWSVRRKAPLILDNAHCAGMLHKGKSIFSYGDAAVLSLHATKILHGFEGGVIFTKHKSVYEKCRSMRNFGFESKPESKHWNHSMSWGTNAKMSEVHAAMALANLETLPELIEHNQWIYELYRYFLPETMRLVELPAEGSNYSYVPVLFPYASMRDQALEFLLERGIIAKKYFDPPCHRLAPFIESNDYLALTEDISSKIACLPTGVQMDEGKVQFVCDRLGNFLITKSPEISPQGLCS